MPNLQDYVRWRGDLTFREHPFNINDNLVLAALSNLDLDGLLTSPDGAKATVRAANAMRHSRGAASSRRLVFVPEDLLEDLGQSRRFADAVLTRYVDITETRTGVQFAAVTVELPDGSSYVSFRGTDTSIVGWREDFTMSFEVMPSQRMAEQYLREVLAATTGPVRVGGHSKGGNLAVYAAMRQSVDGRARISGLYSNDGPGLSPSITDTAVLDELSARTVKIVPEFAIIGRLFDRFPATHVVASSARNVMQHDIMTWQVEGTGLVEAPVESRRASIVNSLIDAYLEDGSLDDQRDFTMALFDALEAGGALVIQDVSRAGYGSFESVLFALVRSRSKTRRSFRTAVQVIRRAVKQADLRGLIRQRNVTRSVMLASTGILFVVVPSLAIQVIASFATLLISVLVAVRLIGYYARFRKRHRVSWPWVAVGSVSYVVLLFAIAHIEILVTPTNLLLGIILLTHGWRTATRGLRNIHRRPRRAGRAAALFLSATLALTLSVVALATSDRVLPVFVLQVGLYFLVAGSIGVFLECNERIRSAYADQAVAADLAAIERRI